MTNRTTDKQGNKIEAVHLNHNVELFLKLQAESRRRNLGTIRKLSRELHINRKRGKHLYRKLEAYGFNYFVLSNAKLFDTIVLEDEWRKWKIGRQWVLDNGKFLNHKKEGFELQIFISLDQLAPFGVEAAPTF